MQENRYFHIPLKPLSVGFNHLLYHLMLGSAQISGFRLVRQESRKSVVSCKLCNIGLRFHEIR